jgi:hypothetical protein
MKHLADIFSALFYIGVCLLGALLVVCALPLILAAAGIGMAREFFTIRP